MIPTNVRLPCADEPWLWDEDAEKHQHVAAAEVCDGCPWRAACLAESIQDRDARGVRAGLLFPSRKRPKLPAWARNSAQPRQLTSDCQPCGSHAAFNRHRKRGEQPCADCWIGERDYQRLRSIRRRNTKSACGNLHLASTGAGQSSGDAA